MVTQVFPSSGYTCMLTDLRCPLASELRARLTGSNPLPGGNPLCRCQNPYQSATASVTWAGGLPTGHVVMDFGSNVAIRLDIQLRVESGHWTVYDTTCAGEGSGTSLYSSTPTTCR